MGISQILHEYVLANITLLLKLQMHDTRDITALLSFVGIPSFRSFLSSAPKFRRLDVGARVQLPKPRHLLGSRPFLAGTINEELVVSAPDLLRSLQCAL